MRLDRLISLRLVDPVLRLKGAPAPATAGRAAVNRLPVLMYHRIADDPEPGISPYYRVCTSPQRFAEQMQWLAAWG